MSDTDLLHVLHEDLVRLAEKLDEHTKSGNNRWMAAQRELAELATKSHSSPCEPMQERVHDLETAQNQAKGGVRVGLAVVALFSAITGGIAALIAIFSNR